MGWTNDQATELTAPTDVPFQPGFDVIGMGTQLPPELIAFGIHAAIVIYNAAYSPTMTTPAIKFFYLGTFTSASLGQLQVGMGVCQNPSVSEVADVRGGIQVGLLLGDPYMSFRPGNGSLGSFNVFTSGGTPTLSLTNAAGAVTWTAP